MSFCTDCSAFPCEPEQRLDKRYRKNFQLSPIANLERIQSVGLAVFVEEQERVWTCDNCAGAVNMHSRECVSCGRKM